ncbi:hypothetical protein [Gloeobacter kilaueensis]|uniref:Uncharacterized protein n=1 Tax=Gloeobacter kilaueensis (strain ATCC BAA-2537 / CCAP 1431/1 / ULC 316 / JS1) TaxID=1183438 RepID=U5QQQ2_GLOK1|nr:hypothetical protein [Gloeobacter kilaueensis]AGY60020.1 hypothetical protein GKIL_3774 [Gloeobacter kilaueensis JS1]
MKSFQQIAGEQGWSFQTQIRLLLEYIESLGDPEGFENFLLDRVDKEDSTDHIGG